MKKTLLTILLFTSFAGMAQKKLVDYSGQYFLENGSLDFVDSSHYNYATWEGSVFGNEPTFGIRPGDWIPIWNYESLDPDFTTAEVWGGSNYPLTQYDTRTKSYAAGLCATDTWTGGTRVSYTYDANGNVTSKSWEWDNMGTWELQYQENMEYDANNRLTVYTEVDASSGTPITIAIDSIEYDGATTNPLRGISYESTDGIVFFPVNEGFFTITAGKLDLLNYYEDDDQNPLTPMVWMFQGEYIWNGSLVTSMDVYPVMAGVPSTTMFGQFAFTFNGNNQLATETATGFEERILTYSYDTDGYLEMIVEQQLDAGMNWYDESIERYYYESTADIENISDIDILVFPNPTSDMVTVKTSESINGIKVLNQNGQTMMIQMNNNEVDLSQLSEGIYHLIITTPSGVTERNVIKK